jgi:hypothetical protein
VSAVQRRRFGTIVMRVMAQRNVDAWSILVMRPQAQCALELAGGERA